MREREQASARSVRAAYLHQQSVCGYYFGERQKDRTEASAVCVVPASELVRKNFTAVACQWKEKVLEAEFLFCVCSCSSPGAPDRQANGSLFSHSCPVTAALTSFFTLLPTLHGTIARPRGVFAIFQEKKENIRREGNRGKRMKRRRVISGDGK